MQEETLLVVKLKLESLVLYPADSNKQSQICQLSVHLVVIQCMAVLREQKYLIGSPKV